MQFKRSAEESQQGRIKKQRVDVEDEDDLEEDSEGEDGEGEEDFEDEDENEDDLEEDYEGEDGEEDFEDEEEDEEDLRAKMEKEKKILRMRKMLEDEDDLEEDYEGEDGEGEEDYEEEDEEDYDSDESSDVEYVQQPQVPQEPRIEDFGGETIPDCCQEHYGLLVIGEVLDATKVKKLKNECCRDVYSGFQRFGLRWYKFRLYKQMYGKDGVRAKCLEILGVSEDASENQIKVAYLKMARKWHPDKNPSQSEEDAAQFKKILNAYETLIGKR